MQKSGGKNGLNSYMPLTRKTREGLIYYGGKNEKH